ncbi:dynactin subunit 1-like [Watersipora subatra]|uniref:dynactin subunit 1-like n=1 Tax=Watersipora subatra TaxID=2589382 RepID=UPI00355C9A87
MVLFSNVNVNQRVELSYRGEVLQAKVRYKGPVHTLDGDWVGLALDKPMGQHNGLYRGRRYFECKGNHGVFVRAGSLRFLPNTTRRMFNKYYRRYDSGTDELLFGGTKAPEVGDLLNDPASIEKDIYTRRSHDNYDLFDSIGSRSFGLSGSVSRQLPAATMKRPMTAAASYTYTSEPIQCHKQRDEESWEPVASIPKTHMPFSAQRAQTQRGWNRVSWTRELSYPKARQAMKSTAWNDISF